MKIYEERTSERKLAEDRNIKLNDFLTVSVELYEASWEAVVEGEPREAKKRLFAFVSDGDDEQIAKFYIDGNGNWCVADPEIDDPHDLDNAECFINALFPRVEAAIDRWLRPGKGYCIDTRLIGCPAVKRLTRELQRGEKCPYCGHKKNKPNPASAENGKKGGRPKK